MSDNSFGSSLHHCEIWVSGLCSKCSTCYAISQHTISLSAIESQHLPFWPLWFAMSLRNRLVSAHSPISTQSWVRDPLALTWVPRELKTHALTSILPRVISSEKKILFLFWIVFMHFFVLFLPAPLPSLWSLSLQGLTMNPWLTWS